MELKLLNDKDGNFHIGRSRGALEKFGSQGALLFGRVEEKSHPDGDLLLDSLFPHVIFICGARGSGKSYTMGVIGEELLDKNAAVAAILVDPVGVFWSMKRPNSDEREKDNLKDWSLAPKGFAGKMKVLVPEGAARKAPKETYDGTFSLRATELTMDDWCLTLGLERFDPASLALERAIDKAGSSYTVDQLVEILTNDPEISSKDTGFSKQTRRGIISRLGAAKDWGLLSDEGTQIEEMARLGELTVLDVSFLEESVACLVVGIVARKLLDARKVAARSEALGYAGGKIPPTWLLIDEAHTIVPNVGRTAASESIVEYVKQGRRPGCSIVIATQQPSAIDSRVLSQLDILVCHKLVFYDDVKSVFRRFPSSVEKGMEDISFIRTMPMGVALIGDREESSSRAFLARIRPRMSQHEGRSGAAVKRKPGELKEAPQTAEPEKTAKRATSVNKEREILCMPHTVSSEQAFETARQACSARGMLQKLLMLVPKEQIISRKFVYYPMWRVSIDIPVSKQVALCLLDGILGEMKAPLPSSGILDLLNMSPAERSILISLNSEKTISQISGEATLDETLAKKHVNRLIEDGLLSSHNRKGETFYKSREAHTLPKPEELIGAQLGASFEREPVEGLLVSPEKSYTDLEKIVTVFGKTTRLRDAHVVYKPYWLFHTAGGAKRRAIAIDATDGRVDDDAGKVLFGRV